MKRKLPNEKCENNVRARALTKKRRNSDSATKMCALILAIAYSNYLVK